MSEESEKFLHQMNERVSYETYFYSDEWNAKRKQKLQEAHNTCERCGARPGFWGGVKLDVHHKTYANLYNESMSDLEVLCHDCHQKQHGRSF